MLSTRGEAGGAGEEVTSGKPSEGVKRRVSSLEISREDIFISTVEGEEEEAEEGEGEEEEEGEEGGERVSPFCCFACFAFLFSGFL